MQEGAQWSITPLDLGSMALCKAVEVYMTGFDIVSEIPLLAWLLRDGRHTVLVDSGPCDVERARRLHRPIVRTPQQALLAALARHNVQASDIDLLVNTHLHWDHCMGNELIPDAPVVIQKDELTYAACPLPCDLRAYEADLGSIYYNSFYSRLKVVEGDCDLLPGLRILHTPGHTPGSQSVLVNTARGAYIIAGDAVSSFEAWNATPQKLPGIFTSKAECYRTYKKLASFQATILPGHEPAIRCNVPVPNNDVCTAR